MNFLELCQELKEELIFIRRQIHANPELGLHVSCTVELIKSKLREKAIEFKECGFGLIADFGVGDEYLLLRADIDALPIQENNNLEFKSEVEGKMHACGHDIHTSMMLGVCYLLKRYEDRLKGPVRVIFQAGEETGEGAFQMLEDGLLDVPISACYAMHVDAKRPLGMFDYGYGKTFASSDSFDIVIHGKSAHGARAHEGVDPISIAVKLYDQLYSIINREVNPFENTLFSVTSMRSEEQAYNIIPSKFHIKASLRTYDENIRGYILNRFDSIISHFKSLYQIEIDFLKSHAIPSLSTDESFTEKILSLVKEIRPAHMIGTKPVVKMGSEDFAFIARKIPKCAYVFIGAGIDENTPALYGQHNANVIFNEDVIPIGCAISTAIAFQHLN